MRSSLLKMERYGVLLKTTPLARLQMEFNIEKLKKDFLELLHVRGYDYSSGKNKMLYRAYLKNRKFYETEGNKQAYRHISLTEYSKETGSPVFWKNEKNINKVCSDIPPYVKSVLDKFSPWLHRSRFSSLAPDSEVKLHRDYSIKYSYRICIPIITNRGSEVFFKKNDELIMTHIPADGSAWFFNQSIPHGAFNRGKSERTHLIIAVQPQFPICDFL